MAADYVCRLLNEMDRRGVKAVTPRAPSGELRDEGILDSLRARYLRRGRPPTPRAEPGNHCAREIAAKAAFLLASPRRPDQELRKQHACAEFENSPRLGCRRPGPGGLSRPLACLGSTGIPISCRCWCAYRRGLPWRRKGHESVPRV
jgi:hypothetical protein